METPAGPEKSGDVEFAQFAGLWLAGNVLRVWRFECTRRRAVRHSFAMAVFTALELFCRSGSKTASLRKV